MPDTKGLIRLKAAESMSELKKTAKPITPDEAAKLKPSPLDPAIVEAFNHLIGESFNGKVATVKLKDVKEMANFDGVPIPPEQDGRWEDLRRQYQDAGWAVSRALGRWTFVRRG